MLPGIQQSASAEEKRLRKMFRELNTQDQMTLLRFAEFLAASSFTDAENITEFPEPEMIPRPESESVVKAIKRLSASYPMIERDRLLNETSNLMAAHVLQGRSAEQVINELEELFQQHYQKVKAEFEQKHADAV